ncbi:MAG: phosphatidate cytidylyltransferase [Muribaculaceae bacterium]|nr:phosphatidate cytidylyltransferase [Muribaculaceae bacterium]
MNIVKRAIFGGIYVALIVASLLLWDTCKWMFVLLFAAFIVLGMNEASKLLNYDGSKTSPLIKVVDALGGIALFSAFFVYYNFPSEKWLPLTLVAAYLLIRLTAQLYMPARNAIADVRQSLGALVYVALPIAMLNTIADVSPRIVLAMFVFIWLNDTGAFLVGCAIGKHRLFERISPKKSWEGVFGGAAFVIAAAIAIACVSWLSKTFNPNGFCVATWIALGVATVVASTLGDLFESLLKRTAGVKDSGNIIPGHGGILDRIDSLLFVALATVIILQIATAIQ